MSKKYTEKDVSRLVFAGKFYSSLIKDAGGIKLDYSAYTYTGTDLDDALKPFLPDPDQELLEAMCREFRSGPYFSGTFDDLEIHEQRFFVDSMRLALQELRRREG